MYCLLYVYVRKYINQYNLIVKCNQKKNELNCTISPYLTQHMVCENDFIN